jgi:hypothetical protein
MIMTYTRSQLINALAAEYAYLCHDDPCDTDMTAAEYLDWLDTLSLDQLIHETDTDDGYTLDEFIHNYG